MSYFINTIGYQHKQAGVTGVLLVNLGTPDAPTRSALRRYLAEFLSDPRVVEMPRLLWWIILHGFILRVRPARSAKSYQKIWLENQGSPLLVNSQKQYEALQQAFSEPGFENIQIALAMRYGNPSIQSALMELKKANVRRLLVLPLYPQYSATTTASVFDAVSEQLKHWRWLPELRFINHYHDYSPYVQAMASHIKSYWQQHGRGEKLLLSFHGIPKRFLLQGDPYYCECHKTSRLLANALELGEKDWQLVFQSRFGREEWLNPYLDKTLQSLAGDGTKAVDVFCPGFSADCLETLEEVAQENRDYFLQAGGQQYRYIPALNEVPDHIQALKELIVSHMQGWQIQVDSQSELQQSQDLAVKQGAES